MNLEMQQNMYLKWSTNYRTNNLKRRLTKVSDKQIKIHKMVLPKPFCITLAQKSHISLVKIQSRSQVYEIFNIYTLNYNSR